MNLSTVVSLLGWGCVLLAFLYLAVLGTYGWMRVKGGALPPDGVPVTVAQRFTAHLCVVLLLPRHVGSVLVREVRALIRENPFRG